MTVDVLERGREFAFGLEPDDQQLEWKRSAQGNTSAYQGPNMAAGLTQDERNAVAQRIFAALCAHYPKHYVALIELKAAASPPERILSVAAAVVRSADDNADGEADTRVKG